MKNNKGFTLIELLVVVAIIGLLAAVVLGALSSARNKGDDAAIKSNLKTIQTQAALYYDNNANSYGIYNVGWCSVVQTTNMYGDPVVLTALRALIKLSGVNPTDASRSRCFSSASAFAVAIQLKTGDTANIDTKPDAWCVDSAGNSKSYTYTTGQNLGNVLNASTFLCN